MQTSDIAKIIKDVFKELTEKYPQIDPDTNEIRYYFCGSAVALLYSTSADCQYLGFNNINTDKFKTIPTKNTYFNQPVRKFHDIDLVTTNTNTKNEIPCFFVPANDQWKNIFCPRSSFYKGDEIEGIKLDNLHQWNGFFDVVSFRDEKTVKPLYLISPEALVAYKVFEICFGEKHMNDLKLLWGSKHLNKKRVKKFIRENLEFYVSMIEFNTALSFYRKYFINIKDKLVISPLLDLFTNKEIKDIFTSKIQDAEIIQENIYTKIDRQFLSQFLSEMKN